MNIKTEARHAAAFLLSEGNGQISRESVVVLAGDALPAGQLLGKVTASGKYDAYDPAASDGTETVSGILYAPLSESVTDRPAVTIARLAEVAVDQLTGFDVAAQADLEARHVIVR